MSPHERFTIPASTLLFITALLGSPSVADAAKSTECTKVGICYCVNDELKATIASRVAVAVARVMIRSCSLYAASARST